MTNFVNLAYLIGIVDERRSHNLLQLSGNTSNLVNVRSTLKSRENSIGNLVGKSSFIPSEEDHTSAGAAERLVCGGSDNVTEWEWRGSDSSSDETRDMSHIHHEESSIFISNFSEFGIVPFAGVGGSSADDERRLKQCGLSSQSIIVDKTRLENTKI